MPSATKTKWSRLSAGFLGTSSFLQTFLEFIFFLDAKVPSPAVWSFTLSDFHCVAVSGPLYMTYLLAQKQSQALSGSTFIHCIQPQALSLMGIVFGFLLVAHPEKFSGASEVHPEKFSGVSQNPEKFSVVSQNPEKFSEVTQTTQDRMPRGVSERKGARMVIS